MTEELVKEQPYLFFRKVDGKAKPCIYLGQEEKRKYPHEMVYGGISVELFLGRFKDYEILEEDHSILVKGLMSRQLLERSRVINLRTLLRDGETYLAALQYLRELDWATIEKYQSTFSSCAIESNQKAKEWAKTLADFKTGKKIPKNKLIAISKKIMKLENLINN